ncbi:NmrA/HSCARG family protein [Streptomyces sp. NPDC086077]|uniref:NmrA/HSCARG family protein n=1 Tax=Streptomyces sp. NPDC086077 TaxID=3154862 RepID=UPI00344064D8
MSDKKIIAVVGATGQQGGGLVRAILADPDGPFTVRALTRNADSPAAEELAAQGAEVVEADLNDDASLRAAFEGAYGAFVVTNFWAELTPEQEAANLTRPQMELNQAAAAARAAKSAGLRHVVWSTLEDTRPHFQSLGSELPTLMDGYKVPHFDAKGAANSYFTEAGVPTTFLETTFYYESLLAGLGQGPQRDDNGDLVLALPMNDAVMALVAAEDIGRTAYGVFRAGAKYVNRTVGVAGAHATGTELAEMLTKALGEKVTYRPVGHDAMRAAGGWFVNEIANMYQFYAEASENFVANRNLDRVRELNPQVKSLDEWLVEHKDQLIG